MPQSVFLNGQYIQRVPLWHADDSAWKAQGVLRMLKLAHLFPRSIGEVGCGTGEVLRHLQQYMDPGCVFHGYDIAPHAIELSRSRQNESLHCQLGDLLQLPETCFDLLLILDVLEHQENHFRFLRDLKSRAPYKIFHSVLDLSAQAVLRGNGLTKLQRTSDDLHFFTKETLLMTLRDEGYQILRWFYAPRAIYRASGFAQRLKQLPRALLFPLNPDFTARALGGFSLFVLAQ